MPIFFHIEAHLWILYTLLGNGLLLNFLLRRVSKSYREITSPLEAQVLSAFVFSLLINYAVLLLFDYLDFAFGNIIYVLVMLTTALSMVVFNYCREQMDIVKSVSWINLVLYLIIFILLFINGGLIDQVSDAWWHMSKANRIAWESSVVDHGRHLSGEIERFYPALWHSNLAMIRELSGQGLPAIWNAFTAWGAVFKAMGFYLLGLGLFRNRGVAFAGAVLFVLLPGIGASYLRVSAWPSHLSYAILFFALYVFCNVDQVTKDRSLVNGIKQLLEQPGPVLLLITLLIAISMLHLFELVLFFCSVFAFFVARSISGFFVTNMDFGGRTLNLNRLVYRAVLAVFFTAAIIRLYLIEYKEFADSPSMIMLPLLILLLLTVELMSKQTIFLRIALGLILALLLLASLDFQHVYALFDASYSLPRTGSFERPLSSDGWFNEKMLLPSWDFQLRQGLLWSGLFGLFISAFLFWFSRSEGALFVFSNSMLVWLVCTSPYIYSWITEALDYHSTWRISLLSFHQLALGAAIALLSRSLFMDKTESEQC